MDGVPWFIGGGAEHPPEVERLLAYAATASNEGVVGISDLKVTAQAAPDGTVQIAPGGAVLRNRYAGGGEQSYIARAALSENLTIPATSAGSGRTDLVVVRIDDPQYPGVPAPATILNGPYVSTYLIQNVPAGTRTAAELNLGYPAIALAKITQPVSNAAVTNAMITDLREVANPRAQRSVFAINLATGVFDIQDSSAADGEQWPNSSGWTVDVPEWATQMRVVATWAQVLIPPGNAVGNLWARLGITSGTYVDSAITKYDTPNAAGQGRATFMLGATLAIPSALRGQRNVPLTLRAKRLSESASTAEIRLDYASSVILDVEFGEQASGV